MEFGGVATSLKLETNSTPNGSQSLLNLVAGSNITLTDDGLGDITIASTGSGGVTSVGSADGSITVTNPTTTPDLSVAMAPKLTTARTISISGDLAYTSPSFDGSGNVTAIGTLATVNANVGSFGSSTSIPTFTVNSKGLITAASGNVVIAPAGTLTGTTLNATVVTSSLTSVGTITSGVWNGTAIANANLANSAITVNGSSTSLGSSVTITVTGTTNRVTVTGGTGLTPTIDISASYVGQSSITTLGTVTTGTLSTGAVLGGVTMTLGSDATGDTYYRNSSGILTRLAVGTSSQVLIGGTTPSWAQVTLTTQVTGVLPIANGGTNSSSALSNQRVMTSVGGAIVESGAITDGEGIQRNNTTFVDAPIDVVVNGRLTLTTAVPVTSADVLAATTVYFALYKGDCISLYDGTRWKRQRFTQQSIKSTDNAQRGTTSNGLKTITGLTNTSQLMQGMKVTGTNVGVAAVISSIDSATQVTVSVASTGSASNTMTFKLVASTPYDVFYVQSSGQLQYSNPWSSGTARADAISLQNGVYVNTSAINSTDSNTIAAGTGLYLGTIYVTSTDGQIEDSVTKRFVWNNYNRVDRNIYVVDSSTATWTYGTVTWRSANGDNTLRAQVVQGLAENAINLSILGIQGTENITVGIGEDVTNANTAGGGNGFGLTALSTPGANISMGFSSFRKVPAIGFHFYQWVENALDGISATFYNFASGARQAGMIGDWWS